MYQCMDSRLSSSSSSTTDPITHDHAVLCSSSPLSPPCLEAQYQAVPSQEVKFASSTPYAFKDLFVRVQISDSEGMSCPNGRGPEIIVPCEPSSYRMHNMPIQPSSVEGQDPLDIELMQSEDNESLVVTPRTSPARDPSRESNNLPTSNANDSKEVDVPDVLSHSLSPVAFHKAGINRHSVPFPSLSLSSQKQMCRISPPLNGDEDEESLPNSHTPSTPPTELHRTPMRHDLPRSSPVISEFGSDSVDMKFKKESPLTQQEHDPSLTLTTRDAIADRASTESSAIVHEKDVVSTNGLFVKPHPSSSILTTALALDLFPPAMSPQPTQTSDVFSPSKRSRTGHLEHMSADTPMKPTKRPRNSKTTTPSHSSIPHKVEHSKLSLPFRSPLLSKPVQSHNVVPQTPIPTEVGSANNHETITCTPTLCKGSGLIITPRAQQVARLNTETTPTSRKSGGAAQNSKAVLRPFKSPFKSPLSSLSSSTTKSVLSPNIQALERKLQLLKRAVKIKASGEEEKLGESISKWRAVGREVSWEVWSVVREQGEGNSWGMDSSSQRSCFGEPEGNWGWDDAADQKRRQGFESNWGYVDIQDAAMEEDLAGSQRLLKSNMGVSPRKSAKKSTMLDLGTDSVDGCQEGCRTKRLKGCNGGRPNVKPSIHSCGQEDEASTPAHTLGTMLRAFGIDDKVFGWDDETEDFAMPG